MNAQTPDAVYTLADLERWKPAAPALAVVGKPVRHSLSPIMHHAALAAMSSRNPELKAWRYHKFELDPSELSAALPKFHAAGFVGLNFTVPHKEVVLGLVEDRTAFADAAGAANTLERTFKGWRAHNTDGPGLAAALEADLKAKLKGAHIVLLGAGGAARAAAMQCLQSGVTQLYIGNRSRDRLDALLKDLRPFAKSTSIAGFDLTKGGAAPGKNAGIINATSLGLKPGDPSPVDLRTFTNPGWVYDMIYNPPLTPLLKQARELGIPCANGLSMLVHQGAQALSIWTGHDAPADVMQRALNTALAR